MDASSASRPDGFGRIALAGCGAALIYATYFPSDSTAVEQGDALWFSALAIFTATMAWMSTVGNRQETAAGGTSPAWQDGIIDVLAWSLAIWIMIAAFATSPPGNPRSATNEGWLWIAGAAWWTGYRRLLRGNVAFAVLTILMEQGYQDLTGQVITRVNDLIRDVEERLVHLVSVAGRIDSISGMEHEAEDKEQNDDRGHGPAINKKDNPEVLNNQDEVDDLLSSLGF